MYWNQIWDFGTSQQIEGSFSLISEASGFGDPDSRFPCLVFWEAVPSAGCSLVFTLEGFSSTFNLDPSIFNEIGISGENLLIRSLNGDEITGIPAAVSIADLANLPDCVLQ